MKKLQVSIVEKSSGSVCVEVPDNATEDEIYDAVFAAYCNGDAYFNDSDITITEHSEV